MYNLDGKIGFIAHPRCASRSVKDVFLGLGAERVKNHHETEDKTVRQIYADGGVVCCVTRNIFDVIVSWYHNRNKETSGDWTFDEFVMKFVIRHSSINHRWFAYPIYHYGLAFSKARLRYEHLENDLNKLLGEWGYPHVKLSHVGKSDRKHYQAYYTPITRMLVQNRWEDDLYLTGHKF